MTKRPNDPRATVYTTRTETGKVTVVCDDQTYQVDNGGHTGLNLVSILPLSQRTAQPDVNLKEETEFTGTTVYLTNDHGAVIAELPAGHYIMNARQPKELTDAEIDALDLDSLPVREYGAYLFQD